MRANLHFKNSHREIQRYGVSNKIAGELETENNVLAYWRIHLAYSLRRDKRERPSGVRENRMPG